jgi:hypothetical protein
MNTDKEIKRIMNERKMLEDILTQHVPMTAAQFCMRATGSGYLSCYINGAKRNRYIKRSEEDKWKKLTLEWKTFSKTLMNWNQLNSQLEKLFKNSGQTRLVPLPAAKERKKK